MIVWLNGTFGAGKTTTARELAALLGARTFDTEFVGYLLRTAFPEPAGDFQHLPLWRPLVVENTARVHEHAGTLVVPQTILVEAYAREIFDGLADRGIAVEHFVLHASPGELRRRIEGSEDTAARRWRLDHVERYGEALPWLRRSATLVDTAAKLPAEVAGEIAARIRGRAPGPGSPAPTPAPG
ncbi:AAA family ATPase [Amycolatopsis sp. OK19-0408]|uniref:AAA family ATPase n=1 Tax=Amycolatopsis iheyensis TaxID=2945988 RepID=A0A9X2NE29_9PSEU|nr:AAA family ATPase [Amycolatopsis iheyensis]MCR6486102.1 AAA family ATPase [Amycolatopsis iheyensis]